MNCECLNDLYHEPNGRKVFCDVDSSYHLVGNGLVEIQAGNDVFHFGVHFENGIATGTGFVCISTNVEQIAGIQFKNDCIVAVDDCFATERAIVDEDSDLEGSTMTMETLNMKDYVGRGSVVDSESLITKMD